MKSLFFDGPGRIYKVPAKIYTFRDTILKSITDAANVVLKPGAHSNGDPKDQANISVVDMLAIELFQAWSEYEDSTEALRLEKEAKKYMNKAVSNLLALPPTSIATVVEYYRQLSWAWITSQK